MAIPDPYLVKFPETKTKLLYAASQLQGAREIQEDYFINFNDECFIIADGVGGMPHGKDAAQLACETALWGYKHIRQHPYYWADKRLFIKRVFRSTNLAVWQKRREPGFEDGLATTLTFVVVGPERYWIGHVGDSSAFLMHQYIMKKLTHDDHDDNGALTKAVGIQRLGLVAQFVTGELFPGDCMLLATDGVTSHLSVRDLEDIIIHTGNTTESITDTVVTLLKRAQDHGSTDNMTACLVKRIAL